MVLEVIFNFITAVLNQCGQCFNRQVRQNFFRQNRRISYFVSRTVNTWA